MIVLIDCENTDYLIEKVREYFSELDPDLEFIYNSKSTKKTEPNNSANLNFNVGFISSGCPNKELILELIRNHESSSQDLIHEEVIDPRKLKLNIDGFNFEGIKKLHEEEQNQENPKRLILALTRGFRQDWINELNMELEKQIRIIKNPSLENILFLEEKTFSSIPQKQKLRNNLYSKKGQTFFRRNKHL